MAWSLTIVATNVTKTFEAWGLGSLKRKLISQAADEVTFDQLTSAFDGATGLGLEKFAHGSAIQIKKEGFNWFYGVIVDSSTQASGSGDVISYKVKGPWWYLDELTYMISWKVYNVPGVLNQTQIYSSHVLLNVDLNVGLGLIKIQQNITNVLTYALSQIAAAGVAAPFQIGTISVDAYAPYEEIRDVTCAEVIRKGLRWSPMSVAYFDYLTSPPTLHIKPFTALTAVTLPIVPAPGVVSILTNYVSDINVTPRSDLQRPSVVIRYEQKNTINGKPYTSVIEDKWPPAATGREIHAMNLSMDVQGSSSKHLSVKIVSLPIDYGNLQWWKNRFPKLSDPNITGLGISVTSWTARDIPANADYLLFGITGGELITGQIPPWVGGITDQLTVVGTAAYQLLTKPGGVPYFTTNSNALPYQAIVTDIASGTYTTTQVLEVAEPLPVGLPKYLYDILSTLHWQGTVTIIEREVRGTIAGGPVVGNVLNVSGGRSEWRTMRALIQTVDEDVDNGTSTYTLGIPEHLGADDLMELLRLTRNRSRSTNANTIKDGVGTSAGEGNLGDYTAEPNSTPGDKLHSQIAVVKSVDDPQRVHIEASSALALKPRLLMEAGAGATVARMDLESHHINTSVAPAVILSTAASGDQQIKFRKVKVCVNIGGVDKTRTIIIPCSDYFSDGDPA